MFMAMDVEHSLAKERNEEIRREVRANRISRQSSRGRRGRRGYFRFIKNLRRAERKVEPKNA